MIETIQGGRMKKIVILLIVVLMLSNVTFALAGSDGMYENYTDEYKLAMDMLSEISIKGNSVVLKESSLNIEVPKIDLELYIQKEQERVLGKNPRESRLLSVDIIDDILNLYPELKEVDRKRLISRCIEKGKTLISENFALFADPLNFFIPWQILF
jgi:hypothetical protein